ncbi:YhcN/YlaJ family sporulation lipoprotein [Sporolactobacillus vineae]|uniref:YhcN/YlaJ family sporulation lipoprotein n=1 Tax=Sporolactobacillus vineae TaxID=444463 RepID=UPI0002897B20|nr:YhcN/YlaJ family sporulation lipoprotein [Sporolactobacillus vineae]
MKRAVLALSAVLTFGSILPGCGYGNAAYNNPNPPRNVSYQPNPNMTNPGNPYVPNNVTNENYRVAGQNNYRSDRRLVKKIADLANGVPGVSRAYTVVNANNVAVGVVPEKGQKNLQTLRKKVTDTVKPEAGNRTVYVTTDRRYLGRVQTAAANFNAGKGLREVRTDITGIIDDLANALKRPFQNNSK